MVESQKKYVFTVQFTDRMYSPSPSRFCLHMEVLLLGYNATLFLLRLSARRVFHLAAFDVHIFSSVNSFCSIEGKLFLILMLQPETNHLWVLLHWPCNIFFYDSLNFIMLKKQFSAKEFFFLSRKPSDSFMLVLMRKRRGTILVSKPTVNFILR